MRFEFGGTFESTIETEGAVGSVPDKWKLEIDTGELCDGHITERPESGANPCCRCLLDGDFWRNRGSDQTQIDTGAL